MIDPEKYQEASLRYLRDVKFHVAVDWMRELAVTYDLSPSELRSVADYAALLIETDDAELIAKMWSISLPLKWVKWE